MYIIRVKLKMYGNNKDYKKEQLFTFYYFIITVSLHNNLGLLKEGFSLYILVLI